MSSKYDFGHLAQITNTMIKLSPEQFVVELKVQLSAQSDDVGARAVAPQKNLDSELVEAYEGVIKLLDEQLKIAEEGEEGVARERDDALKSEKAAWKEVEKAKEERKEVEVRLSQALGDIAQWSKECRNLRNWSDKLIKEVDSAFVCVSVAQGNADNLRRENEELEQEVETLRAGNDRLQQEKREIQKQYSEINQKTVELETQIDYLHEEKRDETERYSCLKGEKDRCQGKIDGFRGEIDGLLEEKGQLWEEVGRLQEEQNRFQEEQDRFQEERGLLRGQMERLQEERDLLWGEVNRLQEERNGLLGERNGLWGERDGLQEERDGLQEERDGYQEERDKLLTQVNELKEQKHALIVVDQKSQEEQGVLKREIDKLQGDITRLGRLSLPTEGRVSGNF
ncbi:hypothetical protein BGZ60DRAFT_429050 [Tricladium varicosporioides]|nr:hypothetical protein BGZ60DRAFT_429050 [Hymenoscyphus varicosporioides]